MSETLTLTFTLIGIVASIAVSIISITIALKKSKPEIENVESLSDKNKAEIVMIYAEELRKIKEENKLEREETFKKISEFEMRIVSLNDKLNEQIRERKEEQLRYRSFINELLLGITKLTGQIQIKGETPVWVPPTNMPFDF